MDDAQREKAQRESQKEDFYRSHDGEQHLCRHERNAPDEHGEEGEEMAFGAASRV